MSKAEDLARRVTFTSNNLHDIEIYKQGFFDGYYQAEKDLALSWEDVQTICKIESEVDAQYCKDGVYSIPIDDVYKEVLRRFNELKGYKV